MTMPQSPSNPDFIRRIRERPSPLRWFILPVFAAAALFWLAILAFIGMALFIELSGPDPSLFAIAVILALLVFFARPMWAVIQPFAAPEAWIRKVFGADVVTDDPAYASLVAEVRGICTAAGVQPVRWICVAPEGVSACVYGLFGSRMAMIFGQDLLDAFADSPDRLRAVIAHEAGHIASGDTRISSMYVIIHDTFMLGLVRPCTMVAGFFGVGIHSLGNRMNLSGLVPRGDAAALGGSWAVRAVTKLMGLAFLCVAAAIWLFGWLASAVVDAFHCAHSRRREFLADRAGAILTSRAAMIDMLTSLEKRTGDGAAATPSALPALQIVNLSARASWAPFRTHPSTEERIERLRSWPDLD